MVEHLEDRDVDAVGAPELGELDADRAAADDDDFLRLIAQDQRFAAVEGRSLERPVPAGSAT